MHVRPGLTYFCCAVDVLYWENRAETVEKNFSQRRYELRCGHQHVYTVTPVEQKSRRCFVYCMPNTHTHFDAANGSGPTNAHDRREGAACVNQGVNWE